MADIVGRDKRYRVCGGAHGFYDAIELIRQHQPDVQATVAEQQKEIQALTASLKEQASQIQKVSAQLEVSKPAPQTVLNNQ